MVTEISVDRTVFNRRHHKKDPLTGKVEAQYLHKHDKILKQLALIPYYEQINIYLAANNRSNQNDYVKQNLAYWEGYLVVEPELT